VSKKQEGEFMKISNFFKFVAKTATVAVAVGSIAYIVKDVMDKKSSDNFDDAWDDDFDEDFDDMFDDDEEEVVTDREYVTIDPSKMAAETCEE
jgi:hypothetical protein